MQIRIISLWFIDAARRLSATLFQLWFQQRLDQYSNDAGLISVLMFQRQLPVLSRHLFLFQSKSLLLAWLALSCQVWSCLPTSPSSPSYMTPISTLPVIVTQRLWWRCHVSEQHGFVFVSPVFFQGWLLKLMPHQRNCCRCLFTSCTVCHNWPVLFTCVGSY